MQDMLPRVLLASYHASTSYLVRYPPCPASPPATASSPWLPHHTHHLSHTPLQLFFAKVPRTVGKLEIHAVFSRYGDVRGINLFRAFRGAPTCKGCGLIKMETREGAEAAKEALDGIFTWPGMPLPMVVDWMDSELQRQRRERHRAQHQEAARLQQLAAAAVTTGIDPCMSALMQPGAQILQPQPLGMPVGLPDGYGLGTAVQGEVPPAGCFPDAIKLFVGNLPAGLEESTLRQLLVTAGHVVQLEMHEPPAGSQTGPSALVWYATRQQAERAILRFNMNVAMKGPAGSSGPLIVRPADDWQRRALPPGLGSGGGAAAAAAASLERLSLSSGIRPAQQRVRMQQQQQYGGARAGMAGGYDGSQYQVAGAAPAAPAGYQVVMPGGMVYGQQEQLLMPMSARQQQQQQLLVVDGYGRVQPQPQAQQRLQPGQPAHQAQQAQQQMAVRIGPDGQQYSLVPSTSLAQYGYPTAAGPQYNLAPAGSQYQAGAVPVQQQWQAAGAADQYLPADNTMPLYAPAMAQQQYAALPAGGQLGASYQADPSTLVPTSGAPQVQIMYVLQ
jgi:hypothetical protein